MRRMLDPKTIGGGGGGSLPSTIKFDEEGNREVEKNLGVDGKLTLKSLVSNDNKDGDITKQLAKNIYAHTLTATDDMGTVIFTVYCSIYYQIDFSKIRYALGKSGGVSATGIINIDGSNKMITSVYVNQNQRVIATWIDTSDRTTGESVIDHYHLKDKVGLVR